MKKSIILPMILLCTGCTIEKDEFIDIRHYQNTSQRSFVPTEIRLSKGDVSTASMNTYDTKASGVTANAILQNLMKLNEQDRVIEISGLYESLDQKGDTVTLSGKIVLPEKNKIKRVILVSHYTIGRNQEAPSRCFPLEGILSKLGYAMIIPDYIGYGVTGDRIHPYLMMDLTSRNVIDMYLSVIPYLKAIGRMPEHDDIYLMGYSQGGATTLGVQYQLEKNHSEKSEAPVKVRRTFAGGGIYDIKYTFDSFVETNKATYPCGVPFVLVGQVYGNNLDEGMLKELLSPKVFDMLDDWFVRKTSTTLQMNEYINTRITSEIMTPRAMDRTSEEICTLYRHMTINSILSYTWTPEAPIYMFHSIDDDTVPFANATRARERWHDANIQYNFGHYGNHQTACMRFIMTVMSILQEEDS